MIIYSNQTSNHRRNTVFLLYTVTQSVLLHPMQQYRAHFSSLGLSDSMQDFTHDRLQIIIVQLYHIISYHYHTETT